MKYYTRVAIWAVVLVLVGSGAFAAGCVVGTSGLTAQSNVPLPKEFDVFEQAWSIVQQHFVDRKALDSTKMTYGAIEGMLNALGDQGHTTFLSPEELKQQQSDMEGKFTGIGAQVGVRDGMSVIVAPFDGSPADKAGVKAGDIIMKVDGEDMSGIDLNEVVRRIRGPADTQVVLTLLRVDGEKVRTLEITITRAQIIVPAVEWGMIPGTTVALVRLSQFSANATDELKKAVRAAMDQDATALILDLRNNPGGLLQQAVEVTSQFVSSGNALQEEDADGKRTPYPVVRGGIATEIPMVALVNAGTASSAEILAGALQDHKRAQIVGETTFGTGTVLTPFTLDDGSAILLGTRQWLTSDGRLIRKQGIKPDVEVDQPVEAERLTTGQLDEISVKDLLASEDAQMLKALELLKALPKAE